MKQVEQQVGQQEDTPSALAAEFLCQHRASGTYRRESIERLASLACAPDDNKPKETAQAATRALFTALIEPLADSFEPRAVTLYNRVFAQLIQHCRQSAAGAALDEALRRFGLLTEGDLLTRAEQLRYLRPFDWRANYRADRNNHSTDAVRERIKSVLVLSRVTIGADVAITSVVFERLMREFPNARLTLVGNPKAEEIFGGNARLGFAAIGYQRAGSLTARLLSWLDVLACVGALSDGLRDDEVLLVDPDSRLTQLGLLPLGKPESFALNAATGIKTPLAENYLFFPSRELGGAARHSLSELTAIWLNTVFGERGGGAATITPRLWLKDRDRQRAEQLVRRFRQPDRRPVITINFGVGDNPRKRVAGDFEEQLVGRLMAAGARIILDKGVGEAETRRAEAVMRAAQQSSYQNRPVKVLAVDEAGIESRLQEAKMDADLLVWSGRIGFLAALISQSDLYIGYDSAGQHLAAALGVPCLDIFAGYSAPRMLDRWRPTGRAATRVIAVDTLGVATLKQTTTDGGLSHHSNATPPDAINAAAVLEDTLDAARALLGP